MVGASSADIRARAAFMIDQDGWSDTSPAAILTPVTVT
jgi:beta-glucosidase